jgi:hypothetical protein
MTLEFGATEDIPWPSASDSLFGPEDDWRAIACLDWARGSAVVRALGYQRAAEVLFEEIAGGRDQDLLVYPFALCWRHHLELELKTLIRAAANFLEEPVSAAAEAALGQHGLLDLWAQCRPLLERVDPRDDTDLDHAGRLIAQLHKIDPSGEAFRYATTKGGEATLRQVKDDRLAVDRFHRVCQASRICSGAAATRWIPFAPRRRLPSRRGRSPRFAKSADRAPARGGFPVLTRSMSAALTMIPVDIGSETRRQGHARCREFASQLPSQVR